MIDYSSVSDKKVLIVGAGGLGGYVITELARIGIKKLVVMDGDTFSESNMNRQLLAGYDTLNKNKAEVYANFLLNSLGIKIEFYKEFFSIDNASIINDVDLIIDCLDSVEYRSLLVDECKKRNKILIHAAVDREEGQIMIIRPNDNNFEKLFKNKEEIIDHSTYSFAVATIASIEVSIACKVLVNEAEDYYNKLIVVDLESNKIMTLGI